MNHKQAWVYHGEKPKAGRRLLLLESDELKLALPLIYRLIHPDEIQMREDWFLSDTGSQSVSWNEKYLSLVPKLQRVTSLRNEPSSLSEPLRSLNLSLNEYFSDFGWRMVRKELSQIKKRQKKAHIELSKDIIVKLKSYMEQGKFESFDQAIDNLLSEVSDKEEA
ncbi:hypothetical protein [uncultured Shewanella sp.]|uniref:hypothetical protein n=1 Tax=Shewanella atlantica TaxID=271099 RepID=UPI00262E71CA|nr:hypothetical protein [uncultured Shewanella sp.]